MNRAENPQHYRDIEDALMNSASSVVADVQNAAPAAAEDLFAALYDELHRLARAQLRGNSGASLSDHPAARGVPQHA
jgi:hypothetical protein